MVVRIRIPSKKKTQHIAISRELTIQTIALREDSLSQSPTMETLPKINHTPRALNHVIYNQDPLPNYHNAPYWYHNNLTYVPLTCSLKVVVLDFGPLVSPFVFKSLMNGLEYSNYLHLDFVVSAVFFN